MSPSCKRLWNLIVPLFILIPLSLLAAQAASTTSSNSIAVSALNSISSSFSYNSLSSTQSTISVSVSHPNATSSVLSSRSGITVSETTTSHVASASAASTSVSTTPSQPSLVTVQQDIATIYERRLDSIIGALSGASNIASWMASLQPDGKWPDSEVDYTTGCEARRANWPAQEHWQRIIVMAAAWHGGLLGAEQYVKNVPLRNLTSLAMNYWFSRDFTNPACLDSGGTSRCPCDNSENSLWNTNWFSNIILIPGLVGQTCVLLNGTLTLSDFNNCTHMTSRSYGTFDHNINGVGFLTGANTLDVAAIGIDLALLTQDSSLLNDAYRRVHLELVIRNEIKADGIRADGSFGQHGGILYNGNYGKDYTNDILAIEIEAAGTQYAALNDSKNAFATLFDGDRWMIYRNIHTGVLHWDFSVLGRFISFPVIDNQATGSIKMNLTQVEVLGEQWSSNSLIKFAQSLLKKSASANAGDFVGNKMFYANDYMVHRGKSYVSTVKMFSSRTQNTECVNSQNPLGFHLSDGAFHTYLEGDEYEDIAASWDWNLIPGITVDYGATPLTCSRTQFTGVDRFVGGVSDGHVGLAVMRYTNPTTKLLRWQKVWFFLKNDIRHVMIAGINSTATAPIYSVLDQRLHRGPVIIDGLSAREPVQAGKVQPRSLWHGNVGYLFPDGHDGPTLTVITGPKTGNWSVIGTSIQPSTTVDLFAAFIQHNIPAIPASYTALPGADFDTFQSKASRLRLRSVQNDAHVSAVLDENNFMVMAVFWDTVGGQTTFSVLDGIAPLTVKANGNAAIIFDVAIGKVTVSDPSQTLLTLEVTFSVGIGRRPAKLGAFVDKKLTFILPQGGLAGSSVSQQLY